MLELTVKTLDSNNHSFTLCDEATVLQLKESIFEKIEVPISSQRLIYHGKVLRDDKKLGDYGDVNGKVIHLVERPPPSSSRPADSTTGRRSESASQGGNANRRFPRRDGPPGFLGSLTFPTFGIGHNDIIDNMEIPVRPSQLMARNRLDCAQRMIGYARQSIRNMAEGTTGDAPRPFRRRAANRASSSGPSTANRGTSTNATEAAQSAEQSDQPYDDMSVTLAELAMITDVLSAQATRRVIVHRQRPEDGQPREGLPPDLVTPTTFHDDVASEVEISDSGSSETDTATEVRDNSTENTAVPGPPNDNRVCVNAMVPILTDMQTVNEQLSPYLQQCRTLLSSEATFDENSNPTQRDASRIFTGVTEALHSIAHAAHAISDLMVDFNEDAPRFLRCRPVVLQHSTIVEAGIPIGVPVNETVNLAAGENAAAAAAAAGGGGGGGGSGGRNNAARNAPASAAPGGPQPTAARVVPIVRHGPNSIFVTSDMPFITPNITNPPLPPPLPPTDPRDILNTMGFRRFEPAHVEVIVENLDYRRLDRNRTAPAAAAAAASGSAGGVPAPTDRPQPPPASTREADARSIPITSLVGRIRDQILGVIDGEAAAHPSLAAQAAALASTANLWPTTSAGEQDVDDSLPIIGATDVEAMLNSYPPWMTRGGGAANTPNNGANATPERTATGSQTTPPRRPVPPMISMMNMVFQQNFDPALPCSSHHIRASRRMPQPNRLRWEMFPSFEAPSVRIITRLGGPRQQQEGGANAGGAAATGAASNTDGAASVPSANANTNVPPTAFSPSDFNHPGFSLRGFLTDIVNRETGFDFAPSSAPNSQRNPSLIRDFLSTIVQNATADDFGDLVAARYSPMLNRLRPTIRDFISRNLLLSETASVEAMTHACDTIFACLRPYIENINVTPLRENVDLSATVSAYNQSQLPQILSLIMGSDTSTVDFGTNLVSRCTLYIRQLLAIIIYCCVDNSEGFDSIVRAWVRLLTQDAPENIRQWTEAYSISNLNTYARDINDSPEQINNFIVHRTERTAQDTRTAEQEPMETDGAAAAVVPPTVDPSRTLNTENLPEVLMGSETWHAAVPSEWVPVIARDVPRQRRASAQKPLSDAYMSGMPPKRRKLIAASKPQGETLPQAISEGVRHAIQAAGVSSPMAERAIAEAGHDRSLQKAYKMQEKATVEPLISDDPDFVPSRYPSAHSFFKK